MNTPVVFLVFNRPDLTRRVFERIREARPSKLLVVCDGPRPARPEDGAKVAAVRAIVDDGVDWPCEVQKNYAEANMGCRNRLASGLDWAFSLVEEAIILEDDCLPNESFFAYCAELLERYRGDERVMHINGTNFLSPHFRPNTSYFFSKYVWVWGWATWRRAWRHYDFTMATWDHRLADLEASFDTRRERAFWLSIFERARQDWQAAQTWDYSWIYSCWTRGGLTIMPTVSMVDNLGFGGEATHTGSDLPHLQIPSGALQIRRHPTSVSRSQFRDDRMFRAYAGERLGWKDNLIGALRVWQCRLSRLADRIKGKPTNAEKLAVQNGQ